MKEKITKAEFINTWASEWDENTGWKVNENFHQQLSEQLEQLIDQEVEKMIAERMPSIEECNNEANIYGDLAGDNMLDYGVKENASIDFLRGASWYRSRLTNPGVNDSQKTEGGGK